MRKPEEIVKQIIRNDQDNGYWTDAARLSFEWFNNPVYEKLLDVGICPECGCDMAPRKKQDGRIDCPECNFYDDNV